MQKYIQYWVHMCRDKCHYMYKQICMHFCIHIRVGENRGVRGACSSNLSLLEFLTEIVYIKKLQN